MILAAPQSLAPSATFATKPDINNDNAKILISKD